MGVVLNGQLQQAAGLLDQQVDLGGEHMEWHGAPQGTDVLGRMGRAYLIQWDVADGRAIDLQDAVTHMDGVFHIGADAVWVHPEGPAHKRGVSPTGCVPAWWGHAGTLPTGRPEG